MLTAGHFYRAFCIAVAVAAIAWMTPASVDAQAQGTPKPAAQGAAKPATPAAAKPATGSVPRTPWGDPDFQGVWEHPDTPAQGIPPDPAVADRLVKARMSRYGPNDPRGRQTSQLSKEKPMIVDPADGLFPTLPGKFFYYDPAIRGDHWTNHFIGERCITKGVPDMYLRGDVHRIVQSPGWVVMVSEFIHDVRMIPVDGRPHLGADIQFWNGDPRGRWDGDTLVIESTNFNDKGQVFAELGGGIKQSSQMRLVERWTRIDAKTIRQEFTVTDPAVFSRPWTAVTTHELQPANFFVVEYACHEGNYNYMTGSLRQGRIRDQKRAGPSVSQ
jgi:hypothetical protein